MSKLIIIHYLAFTKEFQKKHKELASAEWDKYKSIALENSLKLLAYDNDPWGTTYHRISVFESNNGINAWTSFIKKYVAHGTSDAWKYVKASRTNIASSME